MSEAKTKLKEKHSKIMLISKTLFIKNVTVVAFWALEDCKGSVLIAKYFREFKKSCGTSIIVDVYSIPVSTYFQIHYLRVLMPIPRLVEKFDTRLRRGAIFNETL